MNGAVPIPLKMIEKYADKIALDRGFIFKIIFKNGLHGRFRSARSVGKKKVFHPFFSFLGAFDVFTKPFRMRKSGDLPTRRK